MLQQRAPLMPAATPEQGAWGDGSQVPVQPLAMPDQSLDVPFGDPAAPGTATPRSVRAFRAMVLALPAGPAAGLGVLAFAWMTATGAQPLAAALLAAMSAFALYWIALPVAVALAGALWPARPAPLPPVRPLAVAILLPMYGEDAAGTILPAVALLQRLHAQSAGHRFCLRVLSDTRDAARAAEEARVVRAVALRHPGLDVTWRRRPVNHDFKSGNLRDWLQAEGHRHDAVLVLDADSRMGAATVLRLADELAADPTAALIQTVARVAPGRTVWQRLQSVGSEVHGRTLGQGFAAWTGAEGNYLGHNAIFRPVAFARCAGLPHLPGRAPRGGVILSHDFVEAALLRRAGWAVRVLPEADESFEQAPETLAAHIRRDRRWCQGNLQHLRLLRVPGLHPVSRLHFVQGAMAYLSSLWWLALLILFALAVPVDRVGDAGLHAPLSPTGLAVAVLALLLAPRLVGVAERLCRGRPTWRLAPALLAELVVSVLLAPALMVQQAQAVLSTLAGRDGGWGPHATGRPGLPALLRLHRWETGLGLVLLALVAMGMVTPWLVQIGLSLLLAAPLSWLVQQDAPAWLRAAEEDRIA